MAAVAAAMCLAGPAGSALPTVAAKENQDPSVLEDLLALAGVDGNVGIDLAAFDVPTGTAPSAIVAQGREALAALSAAGTASEALAAAIALEGAQPSIPAPAAGPLAAEVAGLYARMGVVATPAQLAELAAEASALDAELASSLATVVAAANMAADAAVAGDQLSGANAAGAILAALEQLGGAQPQSGAASSCKDKIFEDPLELIIVNGDCNHVYPANKPRVVQIDFGGDEQYYNNAGGASTANFDSVVDPGVNTGDIPLAQILLNTFPLNPTGLAGVLSGFLLGCATPDLCVVETGLNPANLAANSPVAVSADFGSGTDLYSSGASFVQGAGLQAVGVLYDAGGPDSYTAVHSSQGNGMAGGVGVLADVGSGDDTFLAQTRSQGASDAGYLLNLGSGDDTYTAETGSQGAQTVPFPSGGLPALLYDSAGSDTYQGTGIVQGAGNFLADASGDDSYNAVGTATRSFINGFAQGIGFALDSGFLLDGSGDDAYTSNIAVSQGFGGGDAVGALIDLDGDDTYTAQHRAQGACEGMVGATALLYDGAGNDAYTAGNGQGQSRQICVGALVDVSGDDTYTALGQAQGVATTDAVVNTVLLGALIDGAGHDSYTSGAASQGSGQQGIGVLVDADGTDDYVAGASSQGSGFAEGSGVLVDGVQDAARVTADYEVGGGSVAITALAVSPGDDPPGGPSKADSLTAGDFSQGAGTTGGTGILVDNDDETVANGGPHRASYAAGDFSQGASTAGGIGVLANREGRDDYSAGIGSQGSSTGGTLGVFADTGGRDTYTVTNPSVSRGYGDSTPDNVAVGLFVDTDEKDSYDGANVNNYCQEKGDTGLTVDTVPPAIPPGCSTALADFATDLTVVIPAFVVDTLGELLGGGVASPCLATDAFCDDVDNGPQSFGAPLGGWTQVGGLNEWRTVNAATTPVPAGANAHSLQEYYYVGAPGYPGLTYLPSDGTGLLTTDDGARWVSAPFTVPAGATFEMEYAGGSETDFDFLHVHIVDTATLVDTEITTGGGISGSSTYAGGPFSATLAGFAGQNVQIVLRFSSDDLLQTGPGWNVDDIRVY